MKSIVKQMGWELYKYSAGENVILKKVDGQGSSTFRHLPDKATKGKLRLALFTKDEAYRSKKRCPKGSRKDRRVGRSGCRSISSVRSRCPDGYHKDRRVGKSGCRRVVSSPRRSRCPNGSRKDRRKGKSGCRSLK